MANELAVVAAPLSPTELVKRNDEAIRAVRPAVEAHHIMHIKGRRYLGVAGAQAIATAMGYTTGLESLRYVPRTEHLAGYWEAIVAVLLDGRTVGRGAGCVFENESPWNQRAQFARQMMAQTRATGRALKGVMGWACAIIGAENSLAEEMPEQDETPARAPSKAVIAIEAERVIEGGCAGVEHGKTKKGTEYWRVGIENERGGADWFTSLTAVPNLTGHIVELRIGKRVVDGVSRDVVTSVTDKEGA